MCQCANGFELESTFVEETSTSNSRWIVHFLPSTLNMVFTPSSLRRASLTRLVRSRKASGPRDGGLKAREYEFGRFSHHRSSNNLHK